MLLINPPVTKPCEPPLGIGRIAGALESRKIPYMVVDANLEGLYFLIRQPYNAVDTWTKRAIKNRVRDTERLLSWETYSQIDKYKISVHNINRILTQIAGEKKQCVSLNDYENNSLSPVKSEDLIYAFEHPEENVFYPYFHSRFPSLLNDYSPEWIGISLGFLNQAICGFSLAGYIRRIAPTIRLVLGGSLVNSWANVVNPDHLFKGVFDYIIVGPGEEKILNLLKPNETDRLSVTGPSFEQLPLHDYFSPSPIIPYNTSIGCFWNKCTFCPENAEENKYEPLDAERVISDLRNLSGSLQSPLIHFTDSAISPSFLKQYVKRGDKTAWYGFVRCDEHLADPDFGAQLKNSGCILLEIGVESGDSAVLESINKGITIEHVERVLRNLKRCGIATYVYLLFGTPEEDYSAARKTHEFTINNSQYIDFLNISIFNMPVRSDDACKHRTTGFYNGDLSLYTDFEQKKNWGRKEVRIFLDTEFKRNKAISRIIQRKPPSFTSNHAPLFIMSGSRIIPDFSQKK
jgi:hypothetical protein